jgi:multiple antibiotic resistance protein
MADFLGAMMFALATLTPIVNPPGVAPIFLSMTHGASDAARTTLAGRIARNSCLLLLAAMVIGSYVLMFFGLTLVTIRIAGGLLVIATAWHLIQAEHGTELKIVTSPPCSAEPLSRSSFYPLTFPVTIGPGSISVAVTLGAAVRLEAGSAPTETLGAIAGIVVVAGAVYFCYRFASRVLGVLGDTGTVVLVRLSAFILLAIGVQILCDGLVERFAGRTPTQ